MSTPDDIQPSVPPAPPAAPALPLTPSARPFRALWFVVGLILIVILSVPIGTIKGDKVIMWLLFDSFVLPFIALVLAIIRPTRSFGQGMLLGTGLYWLWLFTLCSGIWR